MEKLKWTEQHSLQKKGLYIFEIDEWQREKQCKDKSSRSEGAGLKILTKLNFRPGTNGLEVDNSIRGKGLRIRITVAYLELVLNTDTYNILGSLNHSYSQIIIGVHQLPAEHSILNHHADLGPLSSPVINSPNNSKQYQIYTYQKLNKNSRTSHV